MGNDINAAEAHICSRMSVNIHITTRGQTSVDGSTRSQEDVVMTDLTPMRATKNDRFNQIYIPGDIVKDLNAEEWMDGHGSYRSVLPDKRIQICASVAGYSQVFTKVVVVNPIRSRYVGEIGDIVVGRIIQVGRRAWTVDVGAQRNAILNLGAINLPSGELRRKTEEDIDFMRGYLKEGDLVSAEVQKLGAEGHVMLHTRSLRYGRLVQGMLLQVPPKLTKRGKGHFVSYETFGVHLIIGVNGAIWITPTQSKLHIPLGLDQGEQVRKTDTHDYPVKEEMYVLMTDEEAKKHGVIPDNTGYLVLETKPSAVATLEVRKCMARIRNCIEILSEKQVPINRETIRILYDASRKYEPKDLLQTVVAEEAFRGARGELMQELPGAQRVL